MSSLYIHNRSLRTVIEQLISRLEHAEEIAHKAKLKLEKIAAELKALDSEIQSLSAEFSSSSDSKKIEKLNKRKEAASKRAEVYTRYALNDAIFRNVVLFLGLPYLT